MAENTEEKGASIEATMTPWGVAGSLRERRLTPGPGTPREDVRANQRERLMGAMVAVCSSKGYDATSVANLVDLSGVSRKAFYEHFRDKEDCFLATIDVILNASTAVTAASFEFDGTWQERAERGMTAFLDLLVAQPAAGCLCLVEAYAAGPRAVARVDRSMAELKDLMARAFAEKPDFRDMPDEMLWAMVEGNRKMIHSRMHRGAQDELPELGPKLVQLGLLNRAPPVRLRARRRKRDPMPSEDGPGSALDADPAERIIRATYTVVAEKGFGASTIGDIAEAARVSLTTFYEHFDGKREAFDAALYAGRSRMIGYARPAYRRARNWPEAVRAGTEFTLDFLASEPEFARLISRDVYAAGPQALERLELGLKGIQTVIEEGAEQYAPGMDPIWIEAIMSALYAMFCRRMREQGPQSLAAMAPLAVYMALATFIGPEAACEVANGGPLPADVTPPAAALS